MISCEGFLYPFSSNKRILEVSEPSTIPIWKVLFHLPKEKAMTWSLSCVVAVLEHSILLISYGLAIQVKTSNEKSFFW